MKITETKHKPTKSDKPCHYCGTTENEDGLCGEYKCWK